MTSPPYNLRAGAGHHWAWPDAKLFEGYTEHGDDMPHAEYVAWQRACLDQMMRVLRPDGAIFYNHKWRPQKGLLQDRADIVEGRSRYGRLLYGTGA